MNLIVAVDNEWGIGYKGDLLARVKGDLKNFQKVTKGHIVVLGSNTLATFPGGRALKNRTNIVLHPSEEYKPEDCTVAHSIDELLEILKGYPTEEVYIIGGASVYRQMLPYCDVAYVTHFVKSYEKDVTIPDLDAEGDWKMVYKSREYVSDAETDTEGGLVYYFSKYRRIK